jgi:uncharacterized protein (DUF305 family)
MAAMLAALLIAAAISGCGAVHPPGQGHPSLAPSTAPAVHNADDVAFARDMVPHHQQAVEMAAMVPTRTATQNMHVIAANIAADQRAEIESLNDLLAQWGTPGAGGMTDMNGMVDQATMTRLQSLDGSDFDQLWLTAMISHHRGAVTMARAELAHGQNPDAIHMATLIITAQEREIAYMTHLLSRAE